MAPVNSVPRMKTLAIDTSLASGSVAACDSTSMPPRIVDRPLGLPGEHARRLAPAVVEVAADLGWQVRDADMIAVVRGPGSFTGLRVGVTAAKAIAWTTGARLIGVSGFEIVALRTARALDLGTAAVAVAFDAGRGDVYAAVVGPDPASPTGWSMGPATLEPAAAWLASLAAGSVIAGPALDLVAMGPTQARLTTAPREAWFPTAADAAAIALLRAAAGAADDPHSLVPEYSRPSYADEKPRGSSG